MSGADLAPRSETSCCQVSCGYGCMIDGSKETWIGPDFQKFGNVTYYTDNSTKHYRNTTKDWCRGECDAMVLCQNGLPIIRSVLLVVSLFILTKNISIIVIVIHFNSNINNKRITDK
jgi:hypothetical protein